MLESQTKDSEALLLQVQQLKAVSELYMIVRHELALYTLTKLTALVSQYGVTQGLTLRYVSHALALVATQQNTRIWSQILYLLSIVLPS